MAGIGKYEGVGDFKMNAPIQYAPFKMKASGAKYNNSPIEKNFGPAKLRGFNVGGLKGGVQGDPQAKTGVGSGLNMGVAVGSSPAKKWWKKAARIAAGVATGGLSEVAIAGKKALDKRKAAKEAEAAAQAETGGIAQGGGGDVGVPPHTHNPGDGSIEAPGGGAGDSMAGDAVAGAFREKSEAKQAMMSQQQANATPEQRASAQQAIDMKMGRTGGTGTTV
jgi:hypothetical protein